MKFDPAKVRLGRAPARHDARTLRLAKYIKDMPTAPAAIDWGSKVQRWGVLGNDRLGDCTAAGILHMIQLWQSHFDNFPPFMDQDAIDLYSQTCGYVPGHPETDMGGIELDILKQWRKQPIKGVQLLAFAAVDPTNWEQVKLAHWLFGSLYMGVNLPLSAQEEKLWAKTTDAPGGWGGHCMVTSAYADKKGICSFFNSSKLTAVTWGITQNMTPRWVAKYCDELWAPITTAWLGQAGVAPNGFNLAQLRADVAAISNNIN